MADKPKKRKPRVPRQKPYAPVTNPALKQIDAPPADKLLRAGRVRTKGVV